MTTGDTSAAADSSAGQRPDERLPRAMRLPRRSEFLRTYERGRRAHGRLVALFLLEQAPPPAPQPRPGASWRLGITVTRKVGKSVTRNLLRRRVREFFRRRKAVIPPGYDLVVNLKPPAAQASAAELFLDLTRALRRLGFELPENGTPPAPATVPASGQS